MTTVIDRPLKMADPKDQLIQFERLLQSKLKHLTCPSKSLENALHYTALSPGKRFRPSLIYATSKCLQLNLQLVDPIALAVELIHTYSLIHDDLPALDNDNVRRGQPTCHVQFDEATAILCGDALMALAFEVLTSSSTHSKEFLQITCLLAQTIGPEQMVAGQMIDLDTQKPQNLETLVTMHQLKTGRLISFCILAPLVLSSQLSVPQKEAFTDFGTQLGLGFQIRDDILDCTENLESLGKTPLKDQAQNKLTYPGLMGLEQACAHLNDTIDQGLNLLDEINLETEDLRTITQSLRIRGC